MMVYAQDDSVGIAIGKDARLATLRSGEKSYSGIMLAGVESRLFHI
jgi:hypothetical protein